MTAISVLTWNVRYFGHSLRGLRATSSGMKRSAQALASLVPLPDIIALQEVETRSLRAGMATLPQLERFRKLLHDALEAAGRPERFEGLYFPAHAYRLGKGPAAYTTGLAVLVGSRLKVEDSNAADPHDITHVRMSAFKRFKQRRVLAHARVRLRDGGPALDVFNTHLSLPAFLEVGPTQVAARMGDGSNQLEEVGALLSYIQAHAGDAAILVGDFNTRPGSPAYHAILDAGFHDAYATANDLDHHAMHSHGTAGFGPQRMHIDHMFSTLPIDWHGVEAFPFGDRHRFHGLSDHTPKIGRFQLLDAHGEPIIKTPATP